MSASLQTKTAELTLGDFVKHLIASLSEDDSVTIPFQDAEPWHMLFYDLKKTDNPELLTGRPDFFRNLRFDWDGPYPKSRRLEEYLQCLHWNAGVEAHNPGYVSISVDDHVARLWMKQIEAAPTDYKEFLTRATARAKQSFASP